MAAKALALTLVNDPTHGLTLLTPVLSQWKPGTPGAITKLEAFFSGKLHLFDAERAKVDRESTSQLSPWIHAGSISIRYIFYRVSCCTLQRGVFVSLGEAQ